MREFLERLCPMSVFMTVRNTAVLVSLNVALCRKEVPASVYLDYLNLGVRSMIGCRFRS
jgi:hypothetical protein